MKEATREKLQRFADALGRWSAHFMPRDGRTFMTGLEPIVISLIVGGIMAGGQILISYLSRPKPPKQQPRGQHTGETTISDSIWGYILPRIHGKRRSDSIGGIEVGVNVFFASELRTIITTTPGPTSSGGGKGGGGQPTSSPTETRQLKCDFAGAVADGRQRLLRIKANEDVLFDLTAGVGINPQPSGTVYQAEAATIGGDAAVVAVTGFDPPHPSNNGVDLNTAGSVSFTVDGNIPNTQYYTLEIFYKCANDSTIRTQVNGSVLTITLPASTSVRGLRALFVDLPNEGNTIILDQPSESDVRIDLVSVYAEPYIDNYYFGLTGILDPAIPEPLPVTNELLPANDKRDLLLMNRANRPVGEDAPDEVLIIPLFGGGELAFYPGSETQPVDPVIAAWVSSIKGSAAYCPAFLGTAYVRISDFDITKWGSFPNIRVVTENMDTGTVQEILLAEAARADLTADDFDLSAAAGLEVRGYLALNSQAPEKAFQDLGLFHHLAFTESSEGLIKAIDRNDKTSVATLTEDELGAYEANGEESTPENQDFVMTEMPDESEQARTLEVAFFNPLRPSSYGTDRREDVNQFTTSTKKETITLPILALPEEAQRVVRRINQERWHKLAPHKFQVTKKYAWMDAGDCCDIPVDGQSRRVRIEHKVGAAPGMIEMTATDENIYVTPDTNIAVEFDATRMRGPDVVRTPTMTIGTLFDLHTALRSSLKVQPGLYAACHPSGSTNRWRGASLYRYKAGTWQLMTVFNKPCVMGKVVTPFDNFAPEFEAEFDDLNDLIVDIYGDYSPETLLDAFLREGGNPVLVGDEVASVGTWTRDSGFANRWQGTHTLRAKAGTFSAGHVAGERFVLLDGSAIRHIPMDLDEIGCVFQWKFVTHGQSIDSASPIEFAWGGQSNIDRVVQATNSLQLHTGLAGRRMTNENATALVTVQLPEVATNEDKYRFVVTDANGLRLQANGTTRIYYGELASIVGGYVESSVVGSTLMIEAIQGNWYVTRHTGVWEVQTS